jgi:ribonuclease R
MFYNIIDYEIKKSAINVIQNLSYNQVNKILKDNKHEDFEYFDNIKTIVDNIVKNKRLKILEPKLKLELDDDNKYVPILKEKGDAEKIIEELMILTNTYIATHLSKYYEHNLLRIHNSPNNKKLNILKEELKKIGYEFKNEDTFNEIYDLLLEKDLKYKYLISYYLLSVQQKAYYSLSDNGHFALNRSYYTHFTSPIRRYTDILVHRMLNAILYNKKPIKTQNNIIKYINSNELLISKIENKLFYYQTFNYLEHNSVYINGQIISIKNNEYKIRSEYLINGILKFKNTTKKYNIGDFVKLKVLHVNKSKRKLFFIENE